MRFNCLNITKSDSTDFSTYAGIVNRECERFNLTSITDAQFKCLISVCGGCRYSYTEDADIRTRILSKIEENPDVTLQVAVKCLCLVNLKHDSTMVQQSTASVVNTVRKQHHPIPQTSTSIKPPSACWNCGSWHFVRYCTFKTHRCRICNRLAIKKDSPPRMDQDQHRVDKPHITNTNSLVATFLPNPKSKRKYVAVQLNGHPVQQQVDTASDITLISQSLWETIGQPSWTSTGHVAQSASGDCVHITGELPATIKMKDKTASGTIYIANSSHNLLVWTLLNHWVFSTFHSIGYVKWYPVHHLRTTLSTRPKTL